MPDFALEAEPTVKEEKDFKVYTPTIEVFSSGGGTQSTAIAALIIQGKLPKPDFMVIADTGKEMPTTWDYLSDITIPAMRKIGVEVLRIPAMQYANPWGHPSRLFATNGDLLIPAFSSRNNSKLDAFCSNAWKAEVIKRYLKLEHGLDRKQYRRWIGFSMDETARVLRMRNGKDFRQGLIRFPLVEDAPTKRRESIRLVESMGWPTPPRSRCWMCPNQSDMEWREVQQNHPHLFKAAIRMDESIRDKDPEAYFHSSITPLKSVDLSQGEDLFSRSCPSGECFL